MHLSFYTLLMAVLWSSIFAVVLWACRKSTKLVSHFGVWPLLLLSIGVIARCFLPIEIVSFTRPLNQEGVFASLNRILLAPLPGTFLSPLLIFFLLWGLGFLLLLTRFFYRTRRYMKKVNSYEETANSEILSVANQVAANMNIRQYRVIETGSVRVPMVAGLRKPTILLPRCNYAKEDYEYIFLHELTHWKNHDLWVKLLVEFLCDLFWWNPFIYLLKVDLAQVLEIKCDLAVLRARSDLAKNKYLHAIQKTILSGPARDEQKLLPYAVSEFASADKKEIFQRAEVILCYKRRPLLEGTAVFFAVAVMTILFVFSYAFVIQPYYEAPKQEIETKNSREFSQEESYLVENKDGTYSLYQDGEYLSPMDKDTAQFLIHDGFGVK